MSLEKRDGFVTKRSTNIDGFVSRRTTQPARQGRLRHASGDVTRDGRQNLLKTAGVVRASSGPESEDEKQKKRTGKKDREPRSAKRIFKRIFLVFGLLVLLSGAWFGLKFYRDIAKLTGNNDPLALLGIFQPSPLKSQDGRVNILLAGNSADNVGHNGADLTDSIMVLSVDTQNNTALILSVPRDLWVNIPGYGYGKINAAITAGGMDKLQEVVQSDLNIPIDYQVLVNYGAFKDLVDAVGGITIDVQSSDPRGIYDPNLDYTSKNCCALANYPNGWVKLDGQQALDLARARGDPSPYGVAYGFPDGDFDRTEHQRKMLVAVKNKASQTSVIANPFKVSALVDAVGNNIKTNLRLNEIETLYTYMKKINDNDIASYNVNTLNGPNTTMLANYTASDGEDALIPTAGIDDFSAIQARLQKILSPSALERESAAVEVLNGTNTTGLAGQQESTLAGKGMTVSVDDAPATQATSTIIDNSDGKMPNTLAYLKKQYNATVVSSNTLTTTYPDADFILILGQSAAPASTQ
jgi:LCP family protein required for cell wall assembly